MEQKKEWVFLGIVIMIGVFILTKTIRFQGGDGNIKVIVTQQKGSISNIDTPRKVASKKTFHVTTVNFPQTRMLKHKDLGETGYSSNFFIDASVKMEVKSEGAYEFIVSSDDGFRLKIDNKVMCEHPGNRPMAANSCQVHLSKKSHLFELSYWQGGGPLGLIVKYKKMDTSQLRYVGEDSKEITFKESK
ncbi:MAG: hypothetical protein DRG24_02385 [Epsilonproteobacteria bacterium]|nr:MAG: hypothetical protein DRG24_02385 [Campylobacterota bacterium]